MVTRLRHLSKSAFLYESNSRSPRLDKMIAHINLFDRTTQCIEEDLAKEHEQSLAQKRMSNGQPPRLQLGPPPSEYRHKSDTPAWVLELTSRPS